MENKTVIITGTSLGYGKAIAKEFANHGEKNVATMRSTEKEHKLITLINVVVAGLMYRTCNR